MGWNKIYFSGAKLSVSWKEVFPLLGDVKSIFFQSNSSGTLSSVPVQLMMVGKTEAMCL